MSQHVLIKRHFVDLLSVIQNFFLDLKIFFISKGVMDSEDLSSDFRFCRLYRLSDFFL